MRPSLTTMVAKESGDRERKVLEPFKGMGITSKFNDHGIGVLEVNALGDDAAARDASIRQSLSAHGPAIVGQWFDRAEDGTMSAKVVMERGRYSQDDMDRMIQLHSTVDRSGAQGWQLLDLTYVLVYDVTKVEYKRNTSTGKTVKKEGSKKKDGAKGVGNFLDALNKASNANAESTNSSGKSDAVTYTDVFRVDYTVDLYKLQWSDSMEWQFVNRFWNPREAPDAAKAAAWSEASFPMVKVASHKNYMTSRTEVKQSDPPREELLANFAPRMQRNAIERFSKSVRELRPRAPVVEAYPLTARLGTKEAVGVNDRFVALEYKQGRKGYSLKRKGVVRAYKVTKNQTDSEGRMQPSVFQQQGGWRVWPGMSIEERHDLGFNVSGGMQVSTDLISNGPAFTLKSNIMGQLLEFPNFYIGMNLAVTTANGLDANGLVMPRLLDGAVTAKGDTIRPGEWKGNGLAFGLLLSKEFYISNRGNFFLEPTLSYTWVSWKFTGNGSIDFGDKTFEGRPVGYTKWSDDAEKAFSYKAGMFSLGCGLGHHFGPISLEARPMLGFRGAMQYSDDSSWRSANDPGEAVTTKNGTLTEEADALAKDFRFSIVPSAMLALKIRF